MARPKKESEISNEIKELHNLVDALTEDIDRIFNDIYVDPLEELEKPEHIVTKVPEELFLYMEKHCDSMVMGIS